MDLRHISRSEIIAAVGGALLALGVFLPWYVPNTDNRNANVNGARDAVSAFDTYSIMRWLLLAAAVAPIVLLYIVVRDHELSWPRGEMTAIVGVIAFGLTAYVGIVDRPGEPPTRSRLGVRLVHAPLLGTDHRAPPRCGGVLVGALRRPSVAPPAASRGPTGGILMPPRNVPDRNLALELVRVTEAAALAAGRYVGRGDKEAADQAAVDGMRSMLHTMQMDGVVVIGEGEKDEAPMLYNGEQIGDGSPPEVDIAVDPLEGTTLCALGHAERARRDRAVRARHDVRSRARASTWRRWPAPPTIADLLDLDRPLGETRRAGGRAQGLRGQRRDGRRARPPAPRGGHRARSARPARACA